ncbi:MAG: ABC transporter ATP-binding protein [Syntrophobacteraceae bacterium]|nr:ABC transporter ATP-binding protein [Desulfobacteraceae bacterium]
MNPGSGGRTQQSPAPGRNGFLVVDGASKAFEIDGRRIRVFENLRFTVSRGEFLCITGRSGCGKTTLLNMVAGFLAPDSGMLTLDGEPILRPGPDRCVVFQQDALFPWLTVRENIAFGLKVRGWEAGRIRETVDRYLDIIGLGDFQNHLPREISGGMKQRVSLARVLVLEPRVLLVDEPFASLDARTRTEMQDLLASLWAETNCTVLFVTHDIEEAVAMADRVLVLEPSPPHVCLDVAISLERPRDREASGFTGFRRLLQETLRQD